MINQILPTNGKGNLFTGQTGGEAKKGESPGEGGLFKFLMNSVQAEENGDRPAGKNDGQASAANIIGGNLIMNPEKDVPGEGDRLVNILSGLDEKTKNNQVSISELLNGENSRSEEDTDEETTFLVNLHSGANNDYDSAKDVDTEENTGKTIGNPEDEENADFVHPLPEKEDSPDAGSNVSTDKLSDSDNSSDADKTTPSEDNESADEKKEVDGGNLLDQSKLKNDNSTDENSQKGEIEQKENGIKLHTDNTEKALSNTQDTQQSNKADQPAAQMSGDGESKQNVQLNGVSEVSTAGSQKAIENIEGGQKSLFQLDGSKELIIDEEKVQSGSDVKENERLARSDQPVRNSGIVNQLRAFAAAQPFTGQPVESFPATEPTDTKTEDAELLQNIFKALSNTNIDQEAAEVRSLKANHIREIRSRNYQSTFANRIDYQATEDSSAAGSSTSNSNSGTDKLNLVSASGIVPTSTSVQIEAMNDDGAKLWKEHIAEYFESNEKNSSENHTAAFARLSEVSVTNISVRRNFATSLGQAIMSATGDGKKAAETWQKHSFILESGKNIQLSARQVDGVLQLKLSSSNSELSKLLLNHQDEIREHLENEIDVKINLQFDEQGGDGQMAEFFSGSNNGSQKGKQAFMNGSAKTKEQSVDEVVPKAVRKFGYNLMEWTA